MIIDKYAYSSKIAAVATGQKLLFGGVPMLLCLISGSVTLSLAVILSMTAFTLYWGNTGLKAYLKLMLIPCGFLVLGVLTIAVDSNGITVDSALKSLGVAAKALACVSCFYFISLNTPMNSLFGFLQRCRLPSVLVELMELIYRFSFMIWGEASRIHTAQVSRLGYRDFSTSIKSLGQLVGALFVSCLSKADRMNTAVESRGFNGRFSYLSKSESHGSILPQVILLNAGIIAFLIVRGVLW